MKLPFRKNKEFLTALYDILGFYPHNIELYRVAFAHKSLAYHRENPKDRKKKAKKPYGENTSKPLNNERLEYLGDAVLETVVSDILFRHFENKREGFLTSTRSKIVQRETLNKLAEEMGLDRLIQAAQGTRVDHTNIGGNAFEALMGAIYLDRGFQYCHWFITNRIIGQYIDLENIAKKEVNFKSKLLEWSQKNRMNIKFNDTQHDDKDKGFECAIVIEGITLGRGTGRSKKEAQQAAAKEALTRMRRDAQTYDSIFRSKEKRTAMEAEESFALPKIDEIEDSLNDNGKRKGKGGNKAAKAENEGKEQEKNCSDEAYDLAYDANAEFEVIDQAEEPAPLTAADYEAKGLPLPPEENELKAPETRAEKRRNRNRTPKTVDDAVNGGRKKKGDKAEKNEAKAAEAPAADDKAKGKNDKAADKTGKTDKTERAEKAEKAEAKTQPKEKRNKKQPRNNAPAEKPLVAADDEKDTSALQTKTATVTFDDEPETPQESFNVDDFEVITPEMLAALEQEEKELHDAADAHFGRPSEAEAEKFTNAMDLVNWVQQAKADHPAEKASQTAPAAKPQPVPEAEPETVELPVQDGEEKAETPAAETPAVTAEPAAPAQEAEPETEQPVARTSAPQGVAPDFIIAKDLHEVEEPAAEAEVEIELKDELPFVEFEVDNEPETGETTVKMTEPLAENAAETALKAEEPAAPEAEDVATEMAPITLETEETAETESVPTAEAPQTETPETDENQEKAEADAPAEVQENNQSEEETLPRLHHLSLDDFLFGITEKTDDNIETLSDQEQTEKKPKKSRNHGRHSKSDNRNADQTNPSAQQENRPKEQKKHEPKKQDAADSAADGQSPKTQEEGKSENAKSNKRRHYRRRPAQKSNNQQ